MLLVHAHPDDETINNGVTMAKYAADGVQVTLVTCTRGEEGEVLEVEDISVDIVPLIFGYRRNWKYFNFLFLSLDIWVCYHGMRVFYTLNTHTTYFIRCVPK